MRRHKVHVPKKKKTSSRLDKAQHKYYINISCLEKTLCAPYISHCLRLQRDLMIYSRSSQCCKCFSAAPTQNLINNVQQLPYHFCSKVKAFAWEYSKTPHTLASGKVIKTTHWGCWQKQIVGTDNCWMIASCFIVLVWIQRTRYQKGSCQSGGKQWNSSLDVNENEPFQKLSRLY